MGFELGGSPHLVEFFVEQACHEAFIVEKPFEGNAFLTVVELNDGPPGGADFYAVVLVFRVIRPGDPNMTRVRLYSSPSEKQCSKRYASLVEL